MTTWSCPDTKATCVQRERPPRRASAAAADTVFARVSAHEPEVEDPPEDLPAGAPAAQAPQLKRKRGRPRKTEAQRPPGEAPPSAGPPQPKRKRGRPRKAPTLPVNVLRKGQAEAVCAPAASVANALLLPGSALPSLELPKVPSLPTHSRLSGLADMFTPLCRRALHACSSAQSASPVLRSCFFRHWRRLGGAGVKTLRAGNAVGVRVCITYCDFRDW